MASIKEGSDRLRLQLETLYGDRAGEALAGIREVCSRYADLPKPARPGLWNERDAVLITYADQVRAPRQAPLATLREFLHVNGMERVFSVVHLLPFFPSTSDDGFSVVDYRQVDPDFGDWNDIDRLRERFDLMFDLVLNHASCQSDWFRQYQQGVEPFTRFFVEADPSDHLREVVRPRSLPLLTPFETSRGKRHVWTTFSADQVDLNYQEPRVLVEMLDVLLGYLRHGARIVRLDAIAFLWKEPGTSCVHLPQTHGIVRMMRQIVDELAPGTLLLTETNVPHAENISYWGNSDEAHMVYNFSLPPLLLDAFLSGDATFFRRWLENSGAPPAGTTYLNFAASHDGIGVRPLEALVPADRVRQLVDAVRLRGGMVSSRAGSDGRDTPYELNITYFDALGDPGSPDGESLHVQRFLASQAVMLALRGIPAVYFHSLLGTPNDHEGAVRTGHARSINRRKFSREELDSLLRDSPDRRQVWDQYIRLLSVRSRQPAFHPDADQQVVECGNPALVAFTRRSLLGQQTILVIANVSSQEQTADLRALPALEECHELIKGAAMRVSNGPLRLNPCEVMWLSDVVPDINPSIP